MKSHCAQSKTNLEQRLILDDRFIRLKTIILFDISCSRLSIRNKLSIMNKHTNKYKTHLSLLIIYEIQTLFI